MSGSAIDLLHESHAQSGTLLCLGIDLVPDLIPRSFSGSVRDRMVAYARELLKIATGPVRPAAFKMNIGFYHSLDRPRQGEYEGSRALADIFDLIQHHAPDIPVILDAKRGDIARSSENYGREAFESWQANALTAPPYMGHDSVEPLLAAAERAGGLVYVLTRTSNPGSDDLQSVPTADGSTVADLVAMKVSQWHRERGCCGAVVGAPFIVSSDNVLRLFAENRVPVLVPGVGTQGGTAKEVMAALRASVYPLPLARVNVSSAITHPWRDSGAPETWEQIVKDAFMSYHEALA